jgi:indole-3-glycerol phosphate synthase
MVAVLNEIVQKRRARLAEAKARVPLATLEKSARGREGLRDFAGAIASWRGLRVVAELKRASPSGGMLRQDYSPRAIALGYEAAGAAALSVLTEEDHFLGSLQHLVEARAAGRLPVLRKDFILEPYQVFESAAAGADALLLIVAALDDRELRELMKLSKELALAALVEVHDEAELERALAAGAKLIGVNNRDLKTLEVDLETSFRLRPRIPAGVIAVSESGIRTPVDLNRLEQAGFDAALIGERFMASEDPGHELAEFLRVEVGARRGAPPRARA